MSNPEGSGERPERVALQQLERAVGEALVRMDGLRGRAEQAETKNGELSELLRRFLGDDAEAGRLLTRLQSLEAENADLKARLARGREGVERMLARLRFLEDQR